MTIKEEAVKNLRDIKSILDELDITWWLDCGTCLGAYRDKDFCEGDEDDIDLGTWFLPNRVEIIKKAKKLGFEVYHEWEREIALKRNGNKIDLFYYDIKDDNAYTCFYSGEQVAKYVVVPKHFFERLAYLEFYGEMYPVPLEIETYLDKRYGNWHIKIPRKEYLCTTDTNNQFIKDELWIHTKNQH